MKDLISHIEYLLHTHNCVIVPGLGGFVLNALPSEKIGVAEFSFPNYELVFNRDLTHNDGLLSESYMKTYDCSFEKATQRIEAATQKLRNELQQKGTVKLGKLGSFVMHGDKRFVYEATSFVRPEVFGLSNVTLKPIIQLQPAVPIQTTNRKTIIRNVGIGTAAAAVIALLLLIFPFNTSTSDLQNAHIFSENNIFAGVSHKTREGEAKSTTLSPSTEKIAEKANTPTPNNQPLSETTVSADEKMFYVVVGVYQVPKVASQIIDALRAEGFSNVSSLSRSGRTDVFVDSFSDKDEAEAYMREIHKNYPNHRDAWVLKY